MIKASPLLYPEVTNIDLKTVTLDESFNVEIIILNRSPVELSCDSVWLTLTDCVPDIDFENKQLEGVKKLLTRLSSDALLDSTIPKNSPLVKKRIPAVINVQPHYDISHSSIASAGIACVNTHELLKRNDSNQSDFGQIKDKIIKDTVSQCFSMDNIVLKPGENRIQFTCKVIFRSAISYERCI